MFSHQYEGPHVHSCSPKRWRSAGPSACITTLALQTKIYNKYIINICKYYKILYKNNGNKLK